MLPQIYSNIHCLSITSVLEHDYKSSKISTRWCNLTEILLKSSCYTHLKHSKPYMFILKKLKKPPDGLFYSSLLCLSNYPNIWLLFLHRISRLLKFNINWIRVPTTYLSIQKCITRRDNPNARNTSWK